ncbi:MAG: hypothetical protein ACRDL6_03810 [Solirubrobacterales bacterium]
MRKFIPQRRPSAGVVIGLLALSVALGGAAVAQNQPQQPTKKKKKKGKKVPYKGLDKEARLKVLPVSATNAGTTADPNSASTFTDLTSVTTKVSTAFPRRVHLVFDGTFATGTATAARGDCRLEADNAAITGTTTKVEPPTAHTADHGSGYGINIVTTPLGGEHTFSVACNETAGDLRARQFQLSALTVR